MASYAKSYVERKLASQDKRFQAALDEAGALSGIHEASRGAEFEGEARSTLARFLPYTYQVHDGFLRPVEGLKKQLNIVIRSRFLPEFWQEVPVELITVAGEVKTTLSDDGRNDYLATAAKLASAAALAGRRRPLPFFALAGALRRSTGHAAWLASLVSDASAVAASVPGLWPAAFSFDEREPVSAISVGPSAPLSAVTADGEELTGVISITAGQLSPSAVCYLWLWACLPSSDGAPGMELGYMRDAVYRELSAAHGLGASYRPMGEDGDMRPVTVSLQFNGDGGERAADVPPGYLSLPDRGQASGEEEASLEDEPAAGESGRRRFMLITLGPWVEEPETWDESLWGGSGTARRRGRGYYEGMTDQELLDASRLFWRFRPDSERWKGIQYALVAHAGTVRAVVRITKMIGPLWGRHGFQGHVLQDSEFALELIGRTVPARQNPATTIELLAAGAPLAGRPGPGGPIRAVHVPSGAAGSRLIGTRAGRSDRLLRQRAVPAPGALDQLALGVGLAIIDVPLVFLRVEVLVVHGAEYLGGVAGSANASRRRHRAANCGTRTWAVPGAHSPIRA